MVENEKENKYKIMEQNSFDISSSIFTYGRSIAERSNDVIECSVIKGSILRFIVKTTESSIEFQSCEEKHSFSHSLVETKWHVFSLQLKVIL